MTDTYEVEALVRASEGAVHDFADAQQIEPQQSGGFVVTYRPAADDPETARDRVVQLIEAKLALSNSDGTIDALTVRTDGEVVLDQPPVEYVTDVEGVPLQRAGDRAVIGTGEIRFEISPEGLRTMAQKIENRTEG